MSELIYLDLVISWTQDNKILAIPDLIYLDLVINWTQDNKILARY